MQTKEGCYIMCLARPLLGIFFVTCFFFRLYVFTTITPTALVSELSNYKEGSETDQSPKEQRGLQSFFLSCDEPSFPSLGCSFTVQLQQEQCGLQTPCPPSLFPKDTVLLFIPLRSSVTYIFPSLDLTLAFFSLCRAPRCARWGGAAEWWPRTAAAALQEHAVA